jgi:hypothetical protein
VNGVWLIEQSLCTALSVVTATHCEDQTCRSRHSLNAADVISHQVGHGATNQLNENWVVATETGVLSAISERRHTSAEGIGGRSLNKHLLLDCLLLVLQKGGNGGTLVSVCDLWQISVV